jgi:unsaturated rhamnogalacturonyl hydrolase
MKRRKFLLGAGVLGACAISGELVFGDRRSAHADVLASVTATSASAQLPTQQSVIAAMTTVNNYWIQSQNYAGGNFGNSDWAPATYFYGNMAAYDIVEDASYLQYTLQWAQKNTFSLVGGSLTRNANSQAAGQTYINLFQRSGSSSSYVTAIETSVLNMVNSTTSSDWSWVDALNMAMPTFAFVGNLLSQTDLATSQLCFSRMYDFYNYTKTMIAGTGLYSTTDHLWYRDASFLPPHTSPNGKSVYWSRGNGWAFAALAKVLAVLPTSDPHWQEYSTTFQQMALALKNVQRSDGFWNSDLGDPTDFPGPESSGTAFFTYGMAHGINMNILDRATYLPVVANGWNALVSTAVQASGLLGYVQQVGVAPGPTSANETHDYAVGAFLMAGKQVALLAAAAVPGPSVTKIGETVFSTIGYSVTNGGSFQTAAIETFQGWQYVIYWGVAGTVHHQHIARRQLPNGAWQDIEFTDYNQTSTDGHNVNSMGICPIDGTIHMAFDMHDVPLNYRVSHAGLATNPETATWSAASFGAVSSDLGSISGITSFTYPRFITEPSGKLLFEGRQGVSGNGDDYLWEYDGAGHWSLIGEYINGTGNNINAYLHGIQYGANGNLYAAWCWRDTPTWTTNHDLDFIYSADNGRTWKNNAGLQIGVAGSTYVTINSAGVKVESIGTNTDLLNQEGMTIDNLNQVHVLNRDTLSGSLSYVHWFRNTAGTWQRRLIPDAPTVLTTNRGKLIADANNNIYAILPSLKIYAASYASGYTDWKLMTNADNGRFSYEPLYDYYRLNNDDGVLSVYYQGLDNSTHTVSQYVLDYTIGGPRQHPNHALAATGGTVTVSSSIGNYGWFKACAIDGNEHSTGVSNGWSSNSNLTIQNHTEWAQLDLGNSYSITEVDLFGRDDSGNVGYGFPINFTIQISSNGSTWTTVYTSPGGGYPQPTSFGAQRFTFNAQSARYILVNGTKQRSNPNDNNYYRMQFAEIEVY